MALRKSLRWPAMSIGKAEEEEAIYGEQSYWASAVRPSRRRSTIEERIAETMLPPCVSSIDILRRSALSASSSWQKRNEPTAKRRTAKKRSGQGRWQTNDGEEGETEEKGEKNVVCGSPWLEDKVVLSWWQWLRFLYFFLLSSPWPLFPESRGRTTVDWLLQTTLPKLQNPHRCFVERQRWRWMLDGSAVVVAMEVVDQQVPPEVHPNIPRRHPAVSSS